VGGGGETPIYTERTGFSREIWKRTRKSSRCGSFEVEHLMTCQTGFLALKGHGSPVLLIWEIPVVQSGIKKLKLYLEMHWVRK